MNARCRRIALMAASASLLGGCAADSAGTAAQPAPGSTPVATDICGPVDFPPLQFGSHLLGDNESPVPYSSTPPTSGWHSSGAIPEGVFTDPLPETSQVSVLEAGGVVVSHHDLTSTDLDRLTTVVREQYLDRVVVTPYPSIPPGSVAFTSWGGLQVCEGLDLAALDAYAGAYASEITPHD